MKKLYVELLIDKLTRDLSPSRVLVLGDSASAFIDKFSECGVDVEGVRPKEQNHNDFLGNGGESATRSFDLILFVNFHSIETLIQLRDGIDSFLGLSDELVIVSWVIGSIESTFSDFGDPGYWAKLMCDAGYCRNLQFSLPITDELAGEFGFGLPWMARFTRSSLVSESDLIAHYEQHLWELEQEAWIHHSLVNQYGQELSRVRSDFSEMNTTQEELIAWRTRWFSLEQSIGWALLKRLQDVRMLLAPPHSLRERFVDNLWYALKQSQDVNLFETFSRLCYEFAWFLRSVLWKAGLYAKRPLHHEVLEVEAVGQPRSLIKEHDKVDIIVCVHNALEDVRRCLESLLKNTSAPFRIVLVDDGSDEPTREYLQAFARVHRDVELLRNNDEAQGYTRSANKGLRESTADYVLLLNSDTVVTSEWLIRMLTCAESDPKIGMVGPLSNTASWQSVPELVEGDDWASNQLPKDISVDEMGSLVKEYSARLYPVVPFLNGFCLLIKRELIDEIGFLDEETFGEGYGEEDDYALRAGYASWKLAVSDDVYVYHAQSRSYTDSRRRRLSARALERLVGKHGERIVAENVEACKNSPALQGIRARVRVASSRREYRRRGHLNFAKRRLLFVLPVDQPSGGANVVIYEAEALSRMGVDVRIFNLSHHKQAFESIYPRLSVPVIYAQVEDLLAHAKHYDAVIATYNISVEWLADIETKQGLPVRAYYVQGYEPYIYPLGSEEHSRARKSYDLFDDLVRFTKTDWTRREVKDKVGVDSSVIGVSADIDLFRPRESVPSGSPVRIAAMIRPDSDYRSPRMTMEILRRVSRRYGRAVEVVIFGTTKDNPDFSEFPLDFPWKLAGILNHRQVASLLAGIDIFVDFSQHQAMGLTALEAMACGAAIIVPERGGAVDFARHEHNSLVVNTDSQTECWHALRRLVENDALRSEIRSHALTDVADYFPERAAFNILTTLFRSSDEDHRVDQA